MLRWRRNSTLWNWFILLTLWRDYLFEDWQITDQSRLKAKQMSNKLRSLPYQMSRSSILCKPHRWKMDSGATETMNVFQRRSLEKKSEDCSERQLIAILAECKHTEFRYRVRTVQLSERQTNKSKVTIIEERPNEQSKDPLCRKATKKVVIKWSERYDDQNGILVWSTKMSGCPQNAFFISHREHILRREKYSPAVELLC